MSNTVINVENLSKTYLISHQNREKYTTLREDIVQGIKCAGERIMSPFTTSSASQQRNDSIEEFHALRDVSFEIKQGDRVGIIGRNGAGKSTLLKVLSRITEPSCGKIEITGRVASLLEVGTGFHPELTGRENIFLNGAILGMGKAEIKRKFDEIVDFAEVEKFLDTPVKRYSSGMYVRLAFAVAAHLEPEILIVDEVLAVGDAQFQKKCLGKMEEVGTEGRTVLFVSHNMAAVSALCKRGILLERGSIRSDSTIRDVVGNYLSEPQSNNLLSLAELSPRKGTGYFKFERVSYADETGTVLNGPITGGFVVIRLLLNKEIISQHIRASILFSDLSQSPVAIFSTELPGINGIDLVHGQEIICTIPKFPLTAGNYLLSLFLEVNGIVSDWIENAISVDVFDGNFFGSGKNLPNGWNTQIVLINHCWSCS
jgi:lipopolysaccharide transport system ATP-binding protein